MTQVLVRKINASRGRIKDTSPLVTPDGFMSEAINVDLTSKTGARKKRNGRSKVNSTALESGSSVQGGFNFLKDDLSRQHDVVVANGVAKINTSSTVYGLDIKTGLDASERVRFFVEDGDLFAINGTDAMWEWSMITLSAESCTVTNGDSAITVGPGTTLSSKHEDGFLYAPDGNYYTISSVLGAQSATLSSAYTGSTTTGSATIIEPPRNCSLSAPSSAPTASTSAYWTTSPWNNIGDPPPDSPSASTTGSCWEVHGSSLIHLRAGATYTEMDEAAIGEGGHLTYDNLATASAGNNGAGACCVVGGKYIYYALGGGTSTRKSFLLDSPYTLGTVADTTNPTNSGGKLVLATRTLFLETGTGNSGVMEYCPVYGGVHTSSNTNLGGIAVGRTGNATAMEYPGSNGRIYLFHGEGKNASYIDATYGWSASPNPGDGVYGIASTPHDVTQYSDTCSINNNEILISSGNGKVMVYSVLQDKYITLPDLPSTLGDGAAALYVPDVDKVYVVKGGNTTTIWELDLSTETYGEFQFAYSYYDTETGYESPMTDASSSVVLYHGKAVVTMADSSDTRIAKRLYFRKRDLFVDHNDSSVDNDDPADGYTKWYWVADIANGTTTYTFDTNVPDDYTLNGFDSDVSVVANTWKYSVPFDGIVFYAGHPSYPNRVYYCSYDYFNNKAMPQRVPEDNFVTVPGGQLVTGLFKYKGQAYVGTDGPFYKINTDPSGNYLGYYLSPTNVSDGLASHDSVVERPDMVFYLSIENGPSVFNGFDSESLALGKIDSEFKVDDANGLAKGYLSNAVAGATGSEILLDVTGYGSTTNDTRHIFNMDVGGWTKGDEAYGNGFFVRNTVLDSNELLSLSYDGFVVLENDGTDNLGSAYEFESRTVMHDGGMPERNKNFLSVVVEAEFEDTTFEKYRTFTGTLDTCKPKNSIYSYIIEMGTDDIYRFDHSCGRMEHLVNMPSSSGYMAIGEGPSGYIYAANLATTKARKIDLSDLSFEEIDLFDNDSNTGLAISRGDDITYAFFTDVVTTTVKLKSIADDGTVSSLEEWGDSESWITNATVFMVNDRSSMFYRPSDGCLYVVYENETNDPVFIKYDTSSGDVTVLTSPGPDYDLFSEVVYCEYSDRVFYFNGADPTKIYEYSISAGTWSTITPSSPAIDMAGNGAFWTDNQYHLYFLSQETNTVLQRYHVENAELEDISQISGVVIGYNVDDRIADFFAVDADFGGQRGFKIPLPPYVIGRRIQSVVRNNSTGRCTVYSDSYVMKPHGDVG